MKKLNLLLGGNLRQYVMIIALVVVIIFFQIITGGILLSPLNITNIIQQNAYILILATGMLLCILTCGNIDLSVGSVAGFIGAVSAVFILKINMPVFPAILISLLIGVLIGAWHGFWIAYVGVPAFITTLAGMLIFRGLTMVILQGMSLAPFPKSYTFISAGFIPDIANIEGINLLAIITGIVASALYILSQVNDRKNKKKYNFEVSSTGAFLAKIAAIVAVINAFTYSLARYKGIPAVLIIVVSLVLIYSFITNKTIPGRHIYAYGGNPKAAKLSGVKTKKVLFWVYVNMGFLAALAGIIFTGRLNSATPKAGNGFELDAIASCFIGGASTTGGIGTVVGAIVGGLLMGVLNNGMSILGVSIDWQQAIKGVVLLAAVSFDVYSKSRSRSV
ncbi:ABC transporter permease [Thermoclostridium stercorarium subsp. thermolacticum DSM 2910]|uniref:Xylose transport system permease protein XylH n=1 Tax=Thermoclostridium stercorarium subsp. thermolacticum DSM 2910 TaxID=1121336 RepID=A0A1B1YG73_THEST|nr:multiple monosaccharide ABC transporter permease [Thermoclostridium stercorarium]AGI40475.1 ABC transporter periplasmic subunit [Thermoclostridium stercorarium subsp. stercorarium DSM 8532]ANW99758.1 ABC transporter permease [Thermoclostridium stercorarium subsp. thermolacticum DSM 2910]